MAKTAIRPVDPPQPTTPTPTPRLLFRPQEVAEMLALSRSKVYELIASGVLPSVTIGGSVRVSAPHLYAWLEAHPRANLPEIAKVVGGRR